MEDKLAFFFANFLFLSKFDCLSFSCLFYAAPINVSTPLGVYVGCQTHYQDLVPGTTTNTISSFTRVRYAEPPIGERRFQPPVEIKRHLGIVNASLQSNMCPQFCDEDPCHSSLLYYCHEDCLFANIYTPLSQADYGATGSLMHLALRLHVGPGEPISGPMSQSVMVYIHGGSYQLNTGSVYNGSVLARYGIVVVTFNYRLGLLGFLTDGTDWFPGNYGLQDQIALLQFVKKYIKYFGGNPSDVTLVGHSAGSSSVQILSVLPAAKGLFSDAISQSGSFQSYFAIYPETTDFSYYFRQVTDVYGCTKKCQNGNRCRRCMRSIPWQKAGICSKETSFQLPRYHGRDTPWKPRIDKKFIPVHPMNLLRKGSINVNNFMTGFTENELAFNYMLILDKQLFIDQKLPSFMVRGLNYDEFQLASNYTCNVYFQWPYTVCEMLIDLYSAKNRSSLDDNRKAYLEMWNDFVMIAPTFEVAAMYEKYTKSTFVYIYDYLAKNTSIMRWYGASHGFELDYVFGAFYSGQFPDMKPDSYPNKNQEQPMCAFMMQLWANFVKENNPTPETWQRGKWEKYQHSLKNIAHLNGSNISMNLYYHGDKVLFWNRLLRTLVKSTSNRRVNEANRHPRQTLSTVEYILITSTSMLAVLLLLSIFCFIKLKRNTKRGFAAEVCNGTGLRCNITEQHVHVSHENSQRTEFTSFLDEQAS